MVIEAPFNIPQSAGLNQRRNHTSLLINPKNNGPLLDPEPPSPWSPTTPGFTSFESMPTDHVPIDPLMQSRTDMILQQLPQFDLDWFKDSKEQSSEGMEHGPQPHQIQQVVDHEKFGDRRHAHISHAAVNVPTLLTKQEYPQGSPPHDQTGFEAPGSVSPELGIVQHVFGHLQAHQAARTSTAVKQSQASHQQGHGGQRFHRQTSDQVLPQSSSTVAYGNHPTSVPNPDQRRPGCPTHKQNSQYRQQHIAPQQPYGVLSDAAQCFIEPACLPVNVNFNSQQYQKVPPAGPLIATRPRGSMSDESNDFVDPDFYFTRAERIGNSYGLPIDHLGRALKPPGWESGQPPMYTGVAGNDNRMWREVFDRTFAAANQWLRTVDPDLIGVAPGLLRGVKGILVRFIDVILHERKQISSNYYKSHAGRAVTWEMLPGLQDGYFHELDMPSALEQGSLNVYNDLIKQIVNIGSVSSGTPAPVPSVMDPANRENTSAPGSNIMAFANFQHASALVPSVMNSANYQITAGSDVIDPALVHTPSIEKSATPFIAPKSETTNKTPTNSKGKGKQTVAKKKTQQGNKEDGPDDGAKPDRQPKREVLKRNWYLPLFATMEPLPFIKLNAETMAEAGADMSKITFFDDIVGGEEEVAKFVERQTNGEYPMWTMPQTGKRKGGPSGGDKARPAKKAKKDDNTEDAEAPGSEA